MKLPLFRFLFLRGGILIFFFLFPLGNYLSFAVEGEDVPDSKKILVLHTFKAKRPWVRLFNRYLVEELKQRKLPHYEVEIENLDLVQFDEKSYKENVKTQLEYKYAESPPDVMIITFSAAIKFITEYDVFPDVPKIFVLPSQSGFTALPHSVAIPFAFDFKGNIEHALDLLPDTQNIYVVAGSDRVDMRNVSQFRNETREFENRISFHYLTDLSTEDLLARVANLPRHSFVYYLSYTADPHGKTVISVDFCKLVGEKSNRPVFTFLDLFTLNNKILGGRVTTTRATVSAAADVVKKILQETPIESIEITSPYFEYIYDWGELVRWNIDKSKLPADSIIQNRTYSFFELFKWQIIGGVFLLIVESLLILFLLINIKKREIAEDRLLAYHAELEDKVKERTEELNTINADLQKALDEIKTLRGIIPICSYCHSIRDDEGAWKRLETYVSDHSEASFSHGICPDCMAKVRAEARNLTSG
ncbi:MAG: hypothetical protein KQH63_08820 [Desulfobulbaceae bacterium]|nr:hypothetical protein [Desulfobulbaceae bacterium]